MTRPTEPSAEPLAPAFPALPERYEDLGRIGLGGMSEVRRVRDVALQREVAMKIDLLDARTGAGVSDAVREGRLIARLQHPGVVPVYDAGELADGRRYVTMPIVEGITLADWVEREHPLAEGARILLAVAEVLAVAHEQGLVHRDVTPRNVLLGRRGEVRLVDFGIAAPEGTVARGGTRGFASDAQLVGGPAERQQDLVAFGRTMGLVLDRCSPSDAALRALAASAIAGQGDASSLAAGLRAAVDGEARRARAAELVAFGLRADLEAADLRPDVARSAARARRLAAAVEPWETGPRRVRADRARDRAEATARRALQLSHDALVALRAACEVDPGNVPADRALVAALVERVVAAEQGRAPAMAAAEEAELRWRDPAAHRAWRETPGRLTLITRPPGLRVTEPDGAVVGVTPLVDVAVRAGSRILRVETPSGATFRHPIDLVHREASRPAPDGGFPAIAGAPILGPEDCYVPAGWARLGGDPLSTDAFPAMSVWVDGFVMRRFPVTVAEYAAFLNDLPPEVAAACAPGEVHASEARPALAGDRWTVVGDGREPITCVSFEAATRYAAWEADRSGLPWRLPHEVEWEKAARGVDGRLLPWGDDFDAACANWTRSRPGAPRRGPVDEFPGDVSPYGVRGLAGNVREWCGNRWRLALSDGRRLTDLAGTGVRSVRGGCWAAARRSNGAAARYGAGAGTRHRLVGLRLTRPLTGSDAADPTTTASSSSPA